MHNSIASTPTHLTRPRILVVTLLATLAVFAMSGVLKSPPADAHTQADWVYVVNPIIDGDSVHNDVSSWWAWGSATAPGSHHVVYSNYSLRNDWSMDIFAKAEGKRFVTPFSGKTNTGHAVESKVVAIAPGCKASSSTESTSSRIARGGYRVTIEAKDTVTGAILGRADLMHVANEKVSVGQKLGAWTVVGYTKKFPYNSCYQVSTVAGIHGHVEFTNKHRYSCWIPKSYNAALLETTRIGKVGAHYSSARAC